MAADILVGEIYIGGRFHLQRSVGRSSSPSSVPSSIALPRTLDSSSSVSKLEMARLVAILCLASVAVAQDR